MKTKSPRFRRSLLRPMVQELETRTLFSYDVIGIQPAALDQPQVNAIVRLTPTGDPLEADFFGITTYNIQAYYDTGASGVLLSTDTADALGVPKLMVDGQLVIYSDVGVGGADNFNVSVPAYVSLAIYGDTYGEVDPNDPWGGLFGSDPPVEAYTQSFGPIQIQIGAISDATVPPEDPFGDLGLGALDVFGMPTIAGKVMVMDPRPVNAVVDAFLNGGDLTELIGGSMRTYLYDLGTPFDAANIDTNPGIPATNRHIRLSYGAFDRFTTVTPDGAAGPTLAENPFLGPNPVLALEPGAPPDDTPPLSITVGAQTTTGSFLLDTGAAASMISQAKASELHVRYRAGTFGTDSPILEDFDGNELPNQFTLSIGGIGGVVKVAGFYTDDITIPTVEGDPIRLLGAPLLVYDITLMDPVTSQPLTLDGIFGMNNVIASAFISESAGSIIPDIGEMTKTPFDFIVFDSVNQTLGLAIPDLNAPPTATLTTAPNVTAAGGTSYSFVVTYSASSQISIASIDNSDLLLTGPGGITAVAKPQTSTLTDGAQVAVTYKFMPPGGVWDALDSGTWAIDMRPAQVSDTAAQSVAPGRLGTFLVKIPDTTPPKATLVSPGSPVAGKGDYFFKVTYTDNKGIKLASLGTGDIRVTGPKGYASTATYYRRAVNSSTSVTVTYRIVAPGNKWDNNDIGNYLVSLRPSQVADTAGNFAVARSLGTIRYANKAAARAVTARPLFSTTSILPATRKSDLKDILA